jgi:hypothetical protein
MSERDVGGMVSRWRELEYSGRHMQSCYVHKNVMWNVLGLNPGPQDIKPQTFESNTQKLDVLT